MQYYIIDLRDLKVVAISNTEADTNAHLQEHLEEKCNGDFTVLKRTTVILASDSYGTFSVVPYNHGVFIDHAAIKDTKDHFIVDSKYGF